MKGFETQFSDCSLERSGTLSSESSFRHFWNECILKDNSIWSRLEHRNCLKPCFVTFRYFIWGRLEHRNCLKPCFVTFRHARKHGSAAPLGESSSIDCAFRSTGVERNRLGDYSADAKPLRAQCLTTKKCAPLEDFIRNVSGTRGASKNIKFSSKKICFHFQILKFSTSFVRRHPRIHPEKDLYNS